MKKDKVISLARKTNDGTMHSPLAALENATDDFKNDEELKGYKKLLILALNDSDDNYDVTFFQAGMTTSQCIALCEVAKVIFLQNMGHIPVE